MKNCFLPDSSDLRKKVLDSTSISKQAKDMCLGDEAELCPIYYHHFALAVYNLYLQASESVVSKDENITLEIENSKYEISRSKLKSCIEAIESADRLGELDTNGVFTGAMCSQELSFSCLMARAFDRFLFDDTSVGACLHQGPIRVSQGSPEACDMYVVSFSNYAPMASVLVSDIKNSDFNQAVIETTLYAHACMVSGSFSDPYSSPVVLGLALTRSEALLNLVVMGNRKLWRIKIADTHPSDPALLCTLYAAVHHLILNPIIESPLEDPLPFKNNEFEHFKTINDRVFVHNNYRNDQKVVKKIFDTQDDEFLSPNADLMIKCGINEATVESMSIDERFVLLSYPHIAGDHSPYRLQQFTGVMKMLQTLHTAGYVHGDVRMKNIVFTKDSSWLIDFDLAKKEGNFYPLRYNFFAEMRHPNAKRLLMMRKIHDRYALYLVMKSVIVASSDVGKRLKRELTGSDKMLDEISLLEE